MTKRTKIVTLEGVTDLTNAELAAYLQIFCARIPAGTTEPIYKLTQKPRVQVAQPAKAKG